jgi:hypothetical protein
VTPIPRNACEALNRFEFAALVRSERKVISTRA